MGERSDTRIGLDDSDTLCLSVLPGQRVRVIAGPLEGSEGIVVKHRSSGRILMRVQQGVYVEMHQLYLETIKKIGKSHD